MMEKVAMPVLLMPAGNDPENLKPGVVLDAGSAGHGKHAVCRGLWGIDVC